MKNTLSESKVSQLPEGGSEAHSELPAMLSKAERVELKALLNKAYEIGKDGTAEKREEGKRILKEVEDLTGMSNKMTVEDLFRLLRTSAFDQDKVIDILEAMAQRGKVEVPHLRKRRAAQWKKEQEYWNTEESKEIGRLHDEIRELEDVLREARRRKDSRWLKSRKAEDQREIDELARKIDELNQKVSEIQHSRYEKFKDTAYSDREADDRHHQVVGCLNGAKETAEKILPLVVGDAQQRRRVAKVITELEEIG